MFGRAGDCESPARPTRQSPIGGSVADSDSRHICQWCEDYLRRKPHKTRCSDKFWPNVQKTDNCWLWTGPISESGYGGFGAHGRNFQAHRFSWFLAFGKIPKGMYVCHRCDVRNCVRPDHLFLGTHLDNMRDKAEKFAERKRQGLIPHRSKPETAAQRAARNAVNWLTRKEISETARAEIRDENINCLTSETKLKHIPDPEQ